MIERILPFFIGIQLVLCSVGCTGEDRNRTCYVDIYFDANGGTVTESEYVDLSKGKKHSFPDNVGLINYVTINGELMPSDFFTTKVMSTTTDGTYFELSNEWLSIRTMGENHNLVEIKISPTTQSRTILTQLFVRNIETCFLTIHQTVDVI